MDHFPIRSDGGNCSKLVYFLHMSITLLGNRILQLSSDLKDYFYDYLKRLHHLQLSFRLSVSDICKTQVKCVIERNRTQNHAKSS